MRASFRWILFFTVLFMAMALFPQADKNNAPQRNGAALSATFLRTRLHNNIYEDPVIRTFEGRLYFVNRNRFRVSVGAEYEPPVDLWPEWLRTKSWMLDLQAYYVALSSDHFSIYVLGGATQQKFSGYYTGHANIIHLLLYVNRNYQADYFGAILGLGLEFRLFKGLALYLELRNRLIFNNEKLGHTRKDPSLIPQAGIGLRYSLPRFRLRRIFRNPNDKYHWF